MQHDTMCLFQDILHTPERLLLKAIHQTVVLRLSYDGVINLGHLVLWRTRNHKKPAYSQSARA